MRVHFLQHVSFETPGLIRTYAEEQGWSCSATHLYEQSPSGPVLPRAEEMDCLVIMGGPMSAYDDDQISWLGDEKRLIDDAIRSGKKVLGVCLGAQLIAAVLGARVYPGKEKEIGWHPVWLTEAGLDSTFFRQVPREFSPLHWHGDTFDLPKGANLLASSELTPQQAFSFGTTVLALQFHFEMRQGDAESIVRHCQAELDACRDHRFVQSGDEILKEAALFRESESSCRALLAAFFRKS